MAARECEDQAMEFDGKDRMVDGDENLLPLLEVRNLSLMFWPLFKSIKTDLENEF